MAINVFDKPAEQHLLNKYVPLPYDALLRGAASVEGKVQGLEQGLASQKNIFKDLQQLHVDDDYAAALKNELVGDVNNFHTSHKDLSSPEAQRDFYELQTKWAGDQRALNLKRNYDAVTTAEAARLKDIKENGNQPYNYREYSTSLQDFIKNKGTYGAGLDKEAVMFSDPGNTKYMSEEDIRKPFEATVNDMVASQSSYSKAPDGKYIYTGTDKARAATQLKSAIDNQKANLMGSLAGKNLVNKYMSYGLDKQKAYDQSWDDMRQSLVSEYVYSESTRHMTGDPYGQIEADWRIKNPVLPNIITPTEAKTIKNPFGSTSVEYTNTLNQYKTNKETLNEQFATRWMEANGIKGQSAKDFIKTTGFSIDKIGQPGFTEVGNLDKSVIEQARTEYAEQTRQQTIASDVYTMNSDKVTQQMGIKGGTTGLNNQVNTEAADRLYATYGPDKVFSGVLPDGKKLEISTSEIFKAMKNEGGYSVIALKDGAIAINTPNGPKSIAAPNTELDPNIKGVVTALIPMSYVADNLLSGFIPDDAKDVYKNMTSDAYALTNGYNQLRAENPLVKTFHSKMDKVLENDRYETSGFAQTLIPSYVTKLDANGSPVLVLDKDESDKNTKSLNNFVQNPANLRSINSYTTDGSKKMLGDRIKDELGIDMSAEDFKKESLQIGALKMGTTSFNGEPYYVLPLMSGKGSIEALIPSSQIQTDAMEITANAPARRAVSIWEYGKQYYTNADVPHEPFKGQKLPDGTPVDIKFSYDLNNPNMNKVIINGIDYTPESGLNKIADAIDKKILR